MVKISHHLRYFHHTQIDSASARSYGCAMYKRNLLSLLQEMLTDTPVLLLNGARQTGKTTLVQQLAQKQPRTEYVSLDEAEYLAAAKRDPAGFIAQFKTPVIIDEAQRAPEIFLPIKVAVDKARRPGQFLLTGSANVLTLPQLADSLAGRMEIATLWPLSQGELAGVKEDFISAVFVNANGTRIEIRATRQLFDDGHVGLYQQGGILEAQSDGGPVQVIIAPNAIAARTKFKLDVVPLAEVLATLQNTLPDGGRLLGGVQLEVSGDPLTEPADVSFPVDAASLDVPAGEVPEHGVYALCEKVELDGQVQYGIVDNMNYEGGRLVTHSPPFPGIVAQFVGK